MGQVKNAMEENEANGNLVEFLKELLTLYMDKTAAQQPNPIRLNTIPIIKNNPISFNFIYSRS